MKFHIPGRNQTFCPKRNRFTEFHGDTLYTVEETKLSVHSQREWVTRHDPGQRSVSTAVWKSNETFYVLISFLWMFHRLRRGGWVCPLHGSAVKKPSLQTLQCHELLYKMNIVFLILLLWTRQTRMRDEWSLGQIARFINANCTAWRMGSIKVEEIGLQGWNRWTLFPIHQAISSRLITIFHDKVALRCFNNNEMSQRYTFRLPLVEFSLSRNMHEYLDPVWSTLVAAVFLVLTRRPRPRPRTNMYRFALACANRRSRTAFHERRKIVGGFRKVGWRLKRCSGNCTNRWNRVWFPGAQV